MVSWVAQDQTRYVQENLSEMWHHMPEPDRKGLPLLIRTLCFRQAHGIVKWVLAMVTCKSAKKFRNALVRTACTYMSKEDKRTPRTQILQCWRKTRVSTKWLVQIFMHCVLHSAGCL